MNAVLSLGANTGHRAANLHAALEALSAVEGITVDAVSTFVESAPVGTVRDQPDLGGVAVRGRFLVGGPDQAQHGHPRVAGELLGGGTAERGDLGRGALRGERDGTGDRQPEQREEDRIGDRVRGGLFLHLSPNPPMSSAG